MLCCADRACSKLRRALGLITAAGALAELLKPGPCIMGLQLACYRHSLRVRGVQSRHTRGLETLTMCSHSMGDRKLW